MQSAKVITATNKIFLRRRRFFLKNFFANKKNPEPFTKKIRDFLFKKIFSLKKAKPFLKLRPCVRRVQTPNFRARSPECLLCRVRFLSAKLWCAYLHDKPFSPPIGKTFPRKVISPVIATSLRTFFFVSAENIAVAIVIPALGPSFGIAPSGR